MSPLAIIAAPIGVIAPWALALWAAAICFRCAWRDWTKYQQRPSRAA